MAAAPPTSSVGPRIDSLLSARLFVRPQLAGDRLTFVSNLGGRLSLYAMDVGGSVPEPLLPPSISLQNPELVEGYSFVVLPRLDRIVVMVDEDGDEKYQPLLVPLDGGFPEPFDDTLFGGRRSHLLEVDRGEAIAYFAVESADEPLTTAVRSHLATGVSETLAASAYGAFPVAWTPDHRRVVHLDGYTFADQVLYEHDPATGERRTIWGTPLDERVPGNAYEELGLRACHVTRSGSGLLVATTAFADAGGFAWVPLDGDGRPEEVAVVGAAHDGHGELEALDRLGGARYVVLYNIDGVSWAYEAAFDEERRSLELGRVLCGRGELGGGVLHGLQHDPASDRFCLSFCTATTPTQLYVLEPDGAAGPRRQTRERALGLDPDLLAAGEDASFVSHDGLRVSARLYLPDEQLGFAGPRPVVHYVHGGPQGQERPDFAWFSMPLIQVLTLEGFAVFVPNARGSTGYGIEYTKRVDRDWGGKDRLDHVHALTEVLSRDERLDTSRTAVAGRSYGGYMTLLLAGRHPELWSAAVDMFGPYDLTTFVERTPPTWKPYLDLAVGNPEREPEFFRERSPRTYVADIACPLLVIQGRNDPRVVEQESRDLVEELRALGKDVDYLVFEDEGHDVLKHANRVRCYETIVEFLRGRLAP